MSVEKDEGEERRIMKSRDNVRMEHQGLNL